MNKTALFVIILFAIIVITGLGVIFVQTNAKLDARTAELHEIIAELNQTRYEMDQVKSELSSLKNDFEETNDELGRITSELEESQELVIETQSELEQTKATLTSELNNVKAELEAANNQVADVTESIALYKETFGEVFAGAVPDYVLNDTQPPAWNAYIPKTTTPVRQYYLYNNPEAENPTYKQLVNFLKEDTTDSYRYVADYYMCGNFAETVHNNAEAAGIRAAIVFIHYNKGIGHAINAFLTTDKGLTYIDDTGVETRGPTNVDTIVNGLKLNAGYNQTFLFPSMFIFVPDDRIVTSIEIYW